MDIIKFWTICSSNSLILTEAQIKRFERYENELKYWNKQVNLISRRDEDNIYERHFLHSLSILKYVDLKKNAVCLDFGTGGGFPGIPLKIAREDLDFLLVDSIQKKIKITDMFAKHTGLKKIKAISCRVEELINDKQYYQQFDYIFARAVGNLTKLIDWTYELLKAEGKFIFLKGGDLQEEINEAKFNFPNLEFVTKDIKLFGAEWLSEEDKKIIICEKK